MDLGMTLKLGYACEPIQNEKDKINIQSTINSLVQSNYTTNQNLAQCNQNLTSAIRTYLYGESLSHMGMYEFRIIFNLDSLSNFHFRGNKYNKRNLKGSINPKVSEIQDIYLKECIPEFTKLIKNMKNINTMRYELLRYMARKSIQTNKKKSPQQDAIIHPPSINCFGCCENFLQICLKFLEFCPEIAFYQNLQKTNLIQIIYDTILSNLRIYSEEIRTASISAICKIAFHGQKTNAGYGWILKKIKEKVLDAISDTKKSNIFNAKTIKNNVDLLILLHEQTFHASVLVIIT